jgi:peptidoglycan hydrolase CwlO-like protein
MEWHFEKKINLSILIELVCIASLICASGVNIQRQLDMLQYDVTKLLINQEETQQKIESLWAKSIGYDYRIKSLERESPDENND